MAHSEHCPFCFTEKNNFDDDAEFDQHKNNCAPRAPQVRKSFKPQLATQLFAKTSRKRIKL